MMPIVGRCIVDAGASRGDAEPDLRRCVPEESAMARIEQEILKRVSTQRQDVGLQHSNGTESEAKCSVDRKRFGDWPPH